MILREGGPMQSLSRGSLVVCVESSREVTSARTPCVREPWSDMPQPGPDREWGNIPPPMDSSLK